MLSVAACGHVPALAHGGSGTGGSTGVTAVSLPPGVMSPASACRLVVVGRPAGFYTHVLRVHLVLTTYGKGEPVESQGDISSGMPARTLVWVVEVQAKAIHWDHSEPGPISAPAASGAAGPSGNSASSRPDTDYSVVMNAKTGDATDFGECRCWPLPLWKVGTVVSLPAQC